MDYNKTINLPKTDFPMRAGLPKREPEMLKRWKDQDVYNELLKKNEGKPLFNLHDGPPFSNGALHMGHRHDRDVMADVQGVGGRVEADVEGGRLLELLVEILLVGDLRDEAALLEDVKNVLCHGDSSCSLGKTEKRLP